MKRTTFYFLGLVCFTFLTAQPFSGKAQSSNFDQYFTSEVLRVDYFLAGNSGQTVVYLDELLREPTWGGPKQLPSQATLMGNLRYNLYDEASGRLIYTKGFLPLYQEWQSTEEAKNLARSMPMSAVMPYPQNNVYFEVERRRMEDGQFEKIFKLSIDPTSYFIRPEMRSKYEVRQLMNNGVPANKVDLVFIPEGYTQAELEKFYQDAQRITNFFFTQAPFDRYKTDFNVYAIGAPSTESGTDIPTRGVYRSTLLNSSFSTFDVSRYLTTFDSKTISNIAANAPCDAIFVLVNSAEYGGGGFFNWYCMGTSDHPLSDTVAIHEFGHSFGGLADEYYTSDVAYSDFYNLSVEPWEPNITTNVNFASKWLRSIDKSTPVPTPRVDKYAHKIGMFEGGGYLEKGIYSPVMDCRMKSNKAAAFCPICQKNIEKMIRYYCGKETITP